MRQDTGISRRQFLQGSAAAAGTFALGGLSANLAFGKGSDAFKVGLIGCGGRGTGAAADCLAAAAELKVDLNIVALADAFADRVKGAKDRFKVADARCFTGLDAYRKLIATDVNLVILATPPGFRPLHFAEAVEAGKNVFMEKPVAVDPTGVRSVIETSALADEKKLGVVAGTQRRHQAAYIETIKRIHDGMIGEIVSAQCYWNQGGLWVHKRGPNESDVAWQIRNWLYFVWLSGDHIVEQHVHNLDVINWAVNAMPERVVAMGGRQARTAPEFGNIYDHFCVEFVYPKECRTISMCRQIDGADNRVSERVAGTKGVSDCCGTIKDHKDNVLWKYEGENPNPYVVEHKDLLSSIRDGKPLNEGKRIAESTMCAVMGRISAYAGREFATEWAMKKCGLDLFPKDLKMDGQLPVEPVARPGVTKLEDLKEPPKRKKGK